MANDKTPTPLDVQGETTITDTGEAEIVVPFATVESADETTHADGCTCKPVTLDPDCEAAGVHLEGLCTCRAHTDPACLPEPEPTLDSAAAVFELAPNDNKGAGHVIFREEGNPDRTLTVADDTHAALGSPSRVTVTVTPA